MKRERERGREGERERERGYKCTNAILRLFNYLCDTSFNWNSMATAGRFLRKDTIL